MKDPRQAYVIVMGVPGCVDTTEVGIFFDALSDHQTKIDVSSLSSRAKREVARIIFDEMARAYDVVQDVSE